MKTYRCGCGAAIARNSKSCVACYAQRRRPPATIVHGFARAGQVHPLHEIWRSMIGRCTNPNNQRYAKYGGRGIKVCERWLTSFVAFKTDMEPRPPGVGRGGRSLYSLDRIDNDGDYEPSNCRWATAKQQSERTTRSVVIEYGGTKRPVAEWSNIMGLPVWLITSRLRRGWSTKLALGF